jgi:hypothetical protein
MTSLSVDATLFWKVSCISTVTYLDLTVAGILSHGILIFDYCLCGWEIACRVVCVWCSWYTRDIFVIP